MLQLCAFLFLLDGIDLMFAGTVLGSMLKKAARFPMLTQISENTARFQENLSKLNQSEQVLLMRFLGSAME